MLVVRREHQVCMIRRALRVWMRRMVRRRLVFLVEVRVPLDREREILDRVV